MKKEIENMQGLFENDAVSLPESLSEENIVKKIKAEQIKQDKKRLKIFPKIVAVGAAAAIAVTCVSIFENNPAELRKPDYHVVQQNVKSESIEYASIDLGVKSKKLAQFDSEEDLKLYFKNIEKEYKEVNRKSIFNSFDSFSNEKTAEVADGSISSTMPMTATTSLATENFNTAKGESDFYASDSLNSSHAETNTQVKGVDEADIIKNDGRYIYTLSGSRLSIIDSTTMTLVYQEEIETIDDEDYRMNSMYVSDNRLVLTGYKTEEIDDTKKKYGVVVDYAYPYASNESIALVYDITDKTNPQRTRVFTQDGYLESTRMVGSILYTVSTFNAEINKKGKHYIPKVDGKVLPVEDIYTEKNNEDNISYVVLSAFDTAKPDSEVGKISLLGRTDVIYCTTDALYVANSHCESVGDADYEDEDYDEYDVTDIHKFSLDGTKLEYLATGKVPGYISEQYQMDAYNDLFRITTDDYDYKTDMDISNLYILDSTLKPIGKLEDFAKDEMIKSTRFMGETAYVVTFRNTDPLFVIDLSDPTKPTIKGKIKLPGFSEYLHPVGDNLLVGIGYSGDDESANFETVKISLFDVSDPAKPVEVDKHIMKNASSDVGFDPKAFVFDSETNTFGLPVTYETYSKDYNYTGTKFYFKTFSVKDGKLVDGKAYLHKKSDYYFNLFRGTYIGDKVYTVSEYSVIEFNRETAEKLRTLDYYEEEEQPYYEEWTNSIGPVMTEPAVETTVVAINTAK